MFEISHDFLTNQLLKVKRVLQAIKKVYQNQMLLIY